MVGADKPLERMLKSLERTGKPIEDRKRAVRNKTNVIRVEGQAIARDVVASVLWIVSE